MRLAGITKERGRPATQGWASCRSSSSSQGAASERILRAITRPSRATAETFIHSWSDTREVRPLQSEAFAFLNDREQQIPTEVTEALYAYNIVPVYWSRREDVHDRLVA